MRLSLVPYRLPLVASLRLAFGTVAHRDGVLVRLEDGAGRVGWGDACPLPGFSPDTLAEAVASLERGGPFAGADALTPAARAALDGARLGLDALARGVTMAEALRPGAAARVAMQALLVGDGPALLARAGEVRRAGYAAAKLKVGALPVDDDAARVRRVHEALGPAVRLRLDANRAWTLGDAQRFAGAVEGVPLDYVEEPLRDAARLAEAAAWLPVALDESLLGATPADLPGWAFARAVVLKPVMLGGVYAALAWADAARALGMDAVVSGAFESGVGTRHAVALAAALGGAPAGLDPYRHLAADVVVPRLPLGTPVVDVAEALSGRVDPGAV